MASCNVAVVTDSSSALGPAVCAAWGITVVPTQITLGGAVYRDEVNISLPRVIAELMLGAPVRVDDPVEADFVTAYSLAADAGATSVVSVHASPQLHHDAIGVARKAAARVGVPVEVIDSRTLSLAQGFATLAGAAVAATGGDHHAVTQAVQATAQGSRLLLTVDDLDYLHRHGLVPRWAKVVTKVTGGRSVIEMRGANASVVRSIRTTEAARAAVIEEIERAAAGMTNPASAVALIGGSAADLGLLPRVAGTWGEQPPGASIAARTGPGTLIAAVAPMPQVFTGRPPAAA